LDKIFCIVLSPAAQRRRLGVTTMNPILSDIIGAVALFATGYACFIMGGVL